PASRPHARDTPDTVWLLIKTLPVISTCHAPVGAAAVAALPLLILSAWNARDHIDSPRLAGVRLPGNPGLLRAVRSARQIRVETMPRDVHADASATVRAVLLAADTTGAGGSRDFPRPPPGATTIVAPASGFLVQVNEAVLLKAAVQTGSVVLIDRFPGSSLIGGTPIGAAWPAAGQAFGDGATLQERIGAAVRTGFERTAVQDVGHGLRQLTDVANKALSPGINDPTTAVHALGHISALLCEIADRDPGPVLLRDGRQQVRAVLARPDLGGLLDAAITQPAATAQPTRRSCPGCTRCSLSWPGTRAPASTPSSPPS
ncbi:MAG: DUF2254 family protein, partial [Streptosporangiaceae bacterium]